MSTLREVVEDMERAGGGVSGETVAMWARLLRAVLALTGRL